MIVPRKPNRDLVVIGKMEFTIRDNSDIVTAWVEIDRPGEEAPSR